MNSSFLCLYDKVVYRLVNITKIFLLYRSRRIRTSIFILSICISFSFLHGSENSKWIDSLKLPLNDTIRGRVMGKLAWAYKFENQAESYRLAKEELNIGKNTKNSFLQMDAYRTLGLYHIVTKRYTEGFEFYDLSLQLAESSQNYFYLATVNSLIAGAYYDQSEFNTSVSYYYKGLDYALKSGNSKVISMLRLNLAAVYTTTNTSLDKAKSLLKAAMAADIENREWAAAALVSSGISELYSRDKETDSALQYLNQSIQFIQKDSSNPFLNGQVKMSIAGTEYNLKNYSQAEKYALEGIEIFESLGITLYMLPGYSILTESEIEKANYIKAEEYAKKLLEIAEENKSKVEICHSYELLATIEKKRNNFKQALMYYEAFKKWNDTLNEEKKLERIAQLDFKTQTQQKLKENESLKAQNASLRKNVLLASVFAILFAILFGLLIHFMRLKNKLNKDLKHEKHIVEEQVKDKIVLLQEVHHRVKNNLTMIKSLLYLQSKTVSTEEAKNVLHDFQNRVQSIAVVHSKLYETDNIATLDLSNLLESIFHELRMTYGNADAKISLHMSGNCEAMDITTSITLGLLFNELMTNSFKYAFKAIDEGSIEIDIKEMKDKIVMQYCDHGPDLEQKFMANDGSFGFKLLHLLPKQIHGILKYVSKDSKSYFELTIPKA